MQHDRAASPPSSLWRPREASPSRLALSHLARSLVLCLVLAPLAATAQGPAAPSDSAEAPESAQSVRQIVEAGSWHPALPALYAERNHALAWSRPGDARRIEARLDDARADGLTPRGPAVGEIRASGGARALATCA